MLNKELLEKVNAQIQTHCKRSKGYEEGPWVNPLVPVDCVSAFAMARVLTEREAFNHYVAVAPEGHVYGYFFEQLGVPVLSVYVDYPPRRCEVLDDLSGLRESSVLIIEDDVISGVTLRLVVGGLKQYNVRSLALYLGRRKEDQQLETIAPEIDCVFLAEDCLDDAHREQYEEEFSSFFSVPDV
jgi:hypothetical protein